MESILEGAAKELSAVVEQEGLTAIDDLAGGRGAGGGLEFLGQDQGSLDDQSLEWGHGIEGAAFLGGLLSKFG